MGPLLPLAMLFGGLWYLDKDKPQAAAGAVKPAAPRYSKTAVSAVTTMRGDTRMFKAADIDLSAVSLEYVTVESGPADIAMFKVLPHVELGAIPASKAIEQALAKGLCVLGSLTLVLAELGREPTLLLFCQPRDAAKYANPHSHFAVLAMPEPPAPPVEVVEPEPKAAPPKRRNGLTKQVPAETPPPDDGWSADVKAEA